MNPRCMALAVTLCVGSALATGCGTIDRESLSGNVDQLRSDAAEGALVAAEAAQGRVPVPFAAIEAAELAHHVEQLRGALEGEKVAAEAVVQLPEAKRIAQRISEALGGLQHSARHRSAAASAGRQLGHAAEQADKLDEELQ